MQRLAACESTRALLTFQPPGARGPTHKRNQMARRGQIETFGIVISLVLAFAAQSRAQDGAWDVKTPLPVGRAGLQAEAVDGIIYAIGGNGVDTLAIEAFDPATGNWTPRAAGSGGHRSAFATAVVDGKIYAFGGGNGAIMPPRSSMASSMPSVATAMQPSWTSSRRTIRRQTAGPRWLRCPPADPASLSASSTGGFLREEEGRVHSRLPRTKSSPRRATPHRTLHFQTTLQSMRRRLRAPW